MSVSQYFDDMSYGPAPEADSEARAWLASHAGGFGHFIGGAFKPAAEGGSFETHDPSTGRVLASLALGTAADIDAAVAAARAAQGPWAAMPGHARARHLYALARAVQRHARLLAVAETLDNGKPIRESRDIDIPLVARHFYCHAGWAQLMDTALAGYAPRGVAGQIIPWNFPLLMLAWKIAPALATGNTVVLKPAEYTSLTALLFAEIAASAGLPPGVLNVVTGAGETGAALVAHPGVDKIAFTGSTEVGRSIRVATAGSGKGLTLELGGKSPFIVFDDADLDSAIEGVVDSIWLNQGQVCCAGSRLLVQEGIYPAFIARLKRRMATLRTGAPLDKCIDLGAVVDPVQRARIDRLVALGVAGGAELYQASTEMPAGGCWYPPTLLTSVHTANPAATEEIFGPVVVAMSFRTPDEAVMLANNTRYGLAASIWSENIGLALDMAAKVVAGVVWVNATNLFDAAAGFGGMRESGFGREGGKAGLYPYLKPKDWDVRAATSVKPVAALPVAAGFGMPKVDRTAKMFIGGKQVRPDSGTSRAVLSPAGALLGEAGEGNRKDIRNAVAAARAASGWTSTSAHSRAQVLYYIAENLAVRAGEFKQLLVDSTGVTAAEAEAEFEASVSRLFSYAAWADKFEGRVHTPPLRGVALGMHEAIGVAGVICPDGAPLLSFISLVAPLAAMGNRVVAVASEQHPLVALALCSVLESSDVPGGVINVVTGTVAGLAKALASHDDTDTVWSFAGAEIDASVERLSAGNLKRTFTGNGLGPDWRSAGGEGEIFLREAVQVKTVWIPWGE